MSYFKRHIPGAAPTPNPYNLRTTNASGESIPAYAVMLVSDASDADANGSYDVTKPDGTDGTHWFNSPVSVPTGSSGGAATNHFPCMAAYDDAATPAAGEEWGPVAGSWLLTDSGTGFRILGGPVGGLVRVEKIGGGGGPNIKYVQVVDLDEGPNEGNDFSAAYQPVQVRELILDGYSPATTGTFTSPASPNSDVKVDTVKGKKKHGSRGNGIGVDFDVDSGISPNAQATFDDATDVLTVKVKSTSVLWSAVVDAVAIPLDGAFVMVADDPSAAVGGIGSLSGGMSGGVDGSWEMTGSRFGIGNADTADQIRIGRKLWVTLSDSSGTWEIVNAEPELRYVEVTEILPDPGDDDDFPEPFQKVAVKELIYTTYQPATSGTIETDNTTIVISTHKGQKKHGIRGNDISVEFAVDSGITPDVQVGFAETGQTLTITVKNTGVTWADVEAAVLAPTEDDVAYLENAFSVIADDPTAEVGDTIADVTATLSGGADGGYSTPNADFLIGDHSSSETVSSRFWVAWDGTARRWEKVGGGGDGSTEFGIGIITTTASPGTTDAPSTDCVVTLASDFGSDVLTGVKNYSPDQALEDRTCRVSKHLGEWVLDWWSCNTE